MSIWRTLALPYNTWGKKYEQMIYGNQSIAYCLGVGDGQQKGHTIIYDKW